jgi:group I intron endonuclease
VNDPVTIVLLGAPVPRYGVAYKITNIITGAAYIGITTQDPRKRFRHHLYDSKRSDHLIHRAIRKYGKNAFQFEIVACAFTKDDLPELEKLLIADHGTFARHGGYNMTTGGEAGKKPCEETLLRMSLASKARWADPAFVEHQRQVQGGKKQSPELVAKRIAHQIGRPLSAEHKASLSRAHRGQIISADHRLKISNALRGRQADPNSVAKRVAALRGHAVSAETRAKLSAALTGRIISEQQRARQSAAMKGRRPTSVVRAKLSEAQRRRWSRARRDGGEQLCFPL